MKNDFQVETGIKHGGLYGYDSGFVTRFHGLRAALDRFQLFPH